MVGIDALRWDEAGRLPAVVQDRHTGEVRMLAWVDREALAATLATGEGHFFSRSRGTLWRKGETSGHVLRVAEVWTDCDQDAVLYLVDPVGPTCHTGREGCFFDRVDGPADGEADAASPTLVRLGRTLDLRARSTGARSYTRTLLDAGAVRIGEKLREEADELARALAEEEDARVVAEAADLVYHALVGLLARGVPFRDVLDELARRFGVSGHAEKAARGAPPVSG